MAENQYRVVAANAVGPLSSCTSASVVMLSTVTCDPAQSVGVAVDARTPVLRLSADAVGHHIEYEMQMLRFTCDYVTHPGIDRDFLYNACLESFVVHARSLLHFLFPDKDRTRPTDIRASKLVKDRALWEAECGPLPNEVKGLHDDASHFVHHLVVRRTMDSTPPWNPLLIRTIIEEKMRLFSRHADHAKLSSVAVASR